MEIELELDETIANKLLDKYKSEDLIEIINNILNEKMNQNTETVESFFGKVDYFDDYNYKELRNRNESFSWYICLVSCL